MNPLKSYTLHRAFAHVAIEADVSTSDRTFNRKVREFRNRLQALVKRAVDDDIDKDDFLTEAQELIEEYYRDAFNRGSGVTADELTDSDRSELDDEIESLSQFLIAFTDDLYGGKYAVEATDRQFADSLTDTLGLRGAFNLAIRIRSWVENLAGFRELGKTYDPSEALYEWKIDPSKDNCDTCLSLNGRRETASVWRTIAIPRRNGEDRLDCKGFNCGCILEKVT